MSHQRDIRADAALEGINDTPEDISNRAKSHKANLSNPKARDFNIAACCSALRSSYPGKAFSSPSGAFLAPAADLTTNPNVAPRYESRITACGRS
ncbi:hypothetical protein DM02DRAFT_677314 [Periconia macrospinosa]|uniref:Uncharacterized protein n=1 Tax=Periconia macrospinosa TaxID=97972 RepID=A0A2V1D3V9_9PLEO|nr:hypothetical protein DM02DRAFT_677314 [Periconia macrospinosa]